MKVSVSPKFPTQRAPFCSRYDVHFLLNSESNLLPRIEFNCETGLLQSVLLSGINLPFHN